MSCSSNSPFLGVCVAPSTLLALNTTTAPRALPISTSPVFSMQGVHLRQIVFTDIRPDIVPDGIVPSAFRRLPSECVVPNDLNTGKVRCHQLDNVAVCLNHGDVSDARRVENHAKAASKAKAIQQDVAFRTTKQLPVVQILLWGVAHSKLAVDSEPSVSSWRHVIPTHSGPSESIFGHGESLNYSRALPAFRELASPVIQCRHSRSSTKKATSAPLVVTHERNAYEPVTPGWLNPRLTAFR